MISEILKPKSKEEITSELSANDLLIESARKGFLLGVEWAIENGADIKNSLALIYAAAAGRRDIVELLLKYEINTFIINGALHWASLNEHKNIIELLLKNGANVNVERSAKQFRKELLNL